MPCTALLQMLFCVFSEVIKAIEMCRAVGFRLLDIRPEHAAAVEHLPMLPGDPFDRLLLARARTEPMHLPSHDAALIADGPASSRSDA